MKRIIGRLASGFVLMLVMQTAGAEESGFLSDYSRLQNREGDMVNRLYIAPGAIESLAAYNSIMVDQPEVFLSADTKYNGAKPDHLKQLADTLRIALTDRLEAGGYSVVDEPGAGAVYVRWAVTDLFLKKKKRNLLAYTPVGLVVHTTAQMAIRDLWKKIDIVELNLEFEFLDSQTSKVLVAAIIKSGVRKAKGQKQVLVSWEALDATVTTFGERIRCALDNARRPAADPLDCGSIKVPDAES